MPCLKGVYLKRTPKVVKKDYLLYWILFWWSEKTVPTISNLKSLMTIVTYISIYTSCIKIVPIYTRVVKLIPKTEHKIDKTMITSLHLNKIMIKSFIQNITFSVFFHVNTLFSHATSLFLTEIGWMLLRKYHLSPQSTQF